MGKNETKGRFTTKSVCLCVCSVCNPTLPDSFREKAILSCCLPCCAFLPPLDVWHQKKSEAGGGGDATGYFLPATPSSFQQWITFISASQGQHSRQMCTHTHGLRRLLWAASLFAVRTLENNSLPLFEVKAICYFWVVDDIRGHTWFVPSFTRLGTAENIQNKNVTAEEGTLRRCLELRLLCVQWIQKFVSKSDAPEGSSTLSSNISCKVCKYTP